MYKCIPLAYFVFFLVSMTNSAYAQNHIAIRPFSTQRTVCGLVFPENDKLSIDAFKINEGSLRNRIDNERYDACPYNVIVKVGKVKLRLDFKRTPTFEDVQSQSAESLPLYFGAVQYANAVWSMVGDEINSEHPAPYVETSEIHGGLFVSVKFMRKSARTNIDPSIKETCHSVTLIGKTVWAGGFFCGKKETDLSQFSEIFSKIVMP